MSDEKSPLGTKIGKAISEGGDDKLLSKIPVKNYDTYIKDADPDARDPRTGQGRKR